MILLTFAAKRVVDLHVPVQRLTLVANASLDALFTFTELALRDGPATSEFLDDTSRIAVTICEKYCKDKLLNTHYALIHIPSQAG